MSLTSVSVPPVRRVVPGPVMAGKALSVKLPPLKLMNALEAVL